jgi:hypothetical protein
MRIRGRQSIERRLERIARYTGVNLPTNVGYRDVTLALADGRQAAPPRTSRASHALASRQSRITVWGEA